MSDTPVTYADLRRVLETLRGQIDTIDATEYGDLNKHFDRMAERTDTALKLLERMERQP